MQSNHGQHPPGLSFLSAVGVIATQITGSARAGVVDVLNAERPALPDDFGGEIDFVVRRANARTELHDHFRRIGPEAVDHLSNRVRDDAEFGALASGMHKPDRRSRRIYDVNCAAVSDVNAERDAALIGDNAIARGEFAAHRAAATAVDYGDVASVDLFGDEQRPTAKGGCVANFLMCGVEPLQYFGFIV